MGRHVLWQKPKARERMEVSNVFDDAMECVSKAMQLFTAMKTEIPAYEKRALAVAPKLKELEALEAKCRAKKEELDDLMGSFEREQKAYSEWKAKLR